MRYKFHLRGVPSIFDTKTGFYIRSGNPFWNPRGPELLDVSIGSKCSAGCSYCYQDAKPNGTLMSIDNFETILKQAKSTVYQIALGGGEPTEHPDLIEIMKLCRKKYGIVPNYTTNGFDISDEIIEASKKYCGAIAVSTHKFETAKATAERFIKAGVMTNYHFVYSRRSMLRLPDLVENFTPKGLNAIILLLYKPIGRATVEDMIPVEESYIKTTKALIRYASKSGVGLGFDACFAPFFSRYTNIDQVQFDTCDGARFSMYIDHDMTATPCSFMKSKELNLHNYSIDQIWTGECNSMFPDFRAALNNGMRACPTCTRSETCMGGCPILPDLAVCEGKPRSQDEAA